MTVSNGQLKKPAFYTGMIGDTVEEMPFGVYPELDESCTVINQTFDKLKDLLHLPSETHGSAEIVDLNSGQMIYKEAIHMLSLWNDSRVKENAAVILRNPNMARKVSWAIAFLTHVATSSKDPGVPKAASYLVS